MLNLERAGAILSLFIPAVWQEYAKSSSPFSQILWDGCDYFYDVQSRRFPFDFAMTICPNLHIIEGNGQATPDSRLAQH